MNKQSVLIGIIGVLSGFIIGFFFANNLNRNANLQPSVSQTNPNNPVFNNPNNSPASGAPNTSGAMLPEIAQALDKAKNEPNNFKAQIQAGETYLKIQDAEKANEFFQRAAAAARQDNVQELTTLGNAFFDLRNYEEAEKWYLMSLAKKPDDVNVRTDLGSTFMERSQPDLDRAIKEYRTSLENDPKHESTLFNLSIALMRKGDMKGARETLDQLKKVSPQSSLLVKLEQKISETNTGN